MHTRIKDFAAAAAAAATLSAGVALANSSTSMAAELPESNPVPAQAHQCITDAFARAGGGQAPYVGHDGNSAVYSGTLPDGTPVYGNFPDGRYSGLSTSAGDGVQPYSHGIMGAPPDYRGPNSQALQQLDQDIHDCLSSGPPVS